MRRILVTGGNKGIGLAIVEAILDRQAATFVYLGSRDHARGVAAAAALIKARADRKDRIAVVALDVADHRSVTAAAKGIEPLHGLVNNAGIGVGSGDLRAVIETNTFGVRRVCETFLPLLDSTAGRVVNVTSAAGPTFVATCSPERQRFFLDASSTWAQLQALLDECLAIAGDKEAFAAKGLGDGEPYGLSKACANTYTLILAREHPGLRVNACTPGFIETDMTRAYLASTGKSGAELGMKTPADGAKAPLHLLFAELAESGLFYGSDGVRSPLDRYRAPGSPPFTGS